MIRPIFVYLTSSGIVKLEGHSYLDYSTLKNKSEFSLRLNFLLRYSPVVVLNYPKLLWNSIRDKTFPDRVVVVSDTRSSKGFQVTCYGKEDSHPKLVVSKKRYSSETVYKWYMYWRKKGVFDSKTEPLFSSLKWEIRENQLQL